jgi:hypothetical protein
MPRRGAAKRAALELQQDFAAFRVPRAALFEGLIWENK